MSLTAPELDDFLEFFQPVNEGHPLTYLAKLLWWWSEARCSLGLPSPLLAFYQALSLWDYMGSHLHVITVGGKNEATLDHSGAGVGIVSWDWTCGSTPHRAILWQLVLGVRWKACCDGRQRSCVWDSTSATCWGEPLIARQLCQSAKRQKDFYL